MGSNGQCQTLIKGHVGFPEHNKLGKSSKAMAGGLEAVRTQMSKLCVCVLCDVQD